MLARNHSRIALLALSILVSPALLAADPPKPWTKVQTNDVIVVDRDTEGTPLLPNELRGSILNVDRLTRQQTVLSNNGPFLGPQDGTWSPERVFFVVDRSAFDGCVFITNLFNGTRTQLSKGQFFKNPRTIQWNDQFGKLLVVDPRSNPLNFPQASGAVIAVDHLSGQQELLLASDKTRDPVGLVPEPEGTFLIIDQQSFNPAINRNGRVLRWSPQSGLVEVLSEGGLLVRPRNGTLGPDGDLYLADFAADPANPGQFSQTTGSVIRIDRETGVQELVSGGGNFLEPWSVTFDNDGFLLVADKGLNNPSPLRGKVHRVNPLTGNQIVAAQGGNFYQPMRVLIVPEDYPELIVTVGRVIAGVNVTVEVDAGTPDNPAGLFYSTTGPGETDFFDDQLTVDLEDAELFDAKLPNVKGHVEFNTNVPQQFAGETVYLQAVTTRPNGSIVKSLVIKREIE